MTRRTSRSNPRPLRLWISLGIMILILFCMTSTAFTTLYSDYLWFQTLDYLQIFTTRLTTSIGLFAIATVISLVFLLINWSFLPHWIAPKDEFAGQVSFDSWVTGKKGAAQAPPKTYSTRPLRILFTGGAIVASFAVGLLYNGLWRALLLAQNGVPFDLADPIFGLDVSFYIFELPWLEALLSRAKILVALTTIGVAIRYALFGQIKSRASTSHLSILGAVWMVLVGLGWILNRYALLQSDLGVVFGAGYTDINARMPLYIIEAVVFFAAAAILLLNVFIRRWRLLIITGISWLALSAIGPAYPATVQQFTVEPNEFIVEKPYIENNIHYTRYAYGLDKIKEQEYSATGTITADDLTNNADALSNVRLWDYRPLIRTYSQLQEIRLYYTFNEVDVDRYTIGGDYTQVMLSARDWTWTNWRNRRKPGSTVT